MKIVTVNFFFLFSVYANFANAIIQKVSQPVVVRNTVLEFLENPFLRKCFQSQDLPSIDSPEVTVIENQALGERIYSFRFNGVGLDPILSIGEEKIPLSKTSDQLGYVVSVAKKVSEESFSLNFAITNKSGEVVNYRLSFDKGQANFFEELSIKQAQKICVRNQIWLGAGLTFVSYDQEVQDLSAKTSFQSLTFGSYHFDLRYYLNSDWGLLGSFKSAPGQTKKEAGVSIDSDRFAWNIAELGFQWRKNDWLIKKTNYMIYPYLRGSAQFHSLPLIKLDSFGVGQMGSANMNQIAIGGGANLLTSDQQFFESYLSLKLPIQSSFNSITPKLHFEGALGYGKKLAGNWTIGLYWYGHYENFDYKINDNSFENLGNSRIIFSSFDVKIGLLF